MSIINPIPQQTLIKLYKGVAWDNTYKDIRWFTNKSQRDTYLANKVLGTWDKCSVVSPGESIKVSITGNFNDVFTGTYLTFSNIGMGDAHEWCAFVRSIDYVNVNTIQINYQIDWIQTYMFNFVIDSCYVEREHVNDDTFGKNTVEEDLEIGEYAIINVHDETYNKAFRCLYLSQVDTDVELKKKDGIAYAVNYVADTYNNPWGTVSTILQQLNQYGEANEVVDFCMCVDKMVTSATGMHESFNVSKDSNEFRFGNDSYTAVNNKMRCYPYKLMTIDNYEGSVEQYRYELFDDNVCSFAVEGTAMPKPCMICFPINYMGWKGSATSPNTVQQFSVMFTNFPEIPWTSDTFRAWVSQNSATLVGNALSKVVQTGVGAAMLASGNPMGVMPLISGATGAAEEVQNVQNHQIHGQQLQGSIPSAGMSYFRDTIGFRATQLCIRPEMARKIDRYFTRYGYRVNEVKRPNITGRQYVNFVKTMNAHVSGDVPVEARDTLEKAMDSGCSFWHVDNIGQQLTSNPIV